MAPTQLLARPGGTLAYDDTGDGGALVVAVPGMGDLRSEYRHLVPHLTAAGHRVVTMDLRGHGESDASFPSYDRPAAGDDVIALIEHLEAGPAHVLGASYGAAAAVWAAAEAPDRVASVTLIGPFVRDVPTPAVQRLGLAAMLARPWGARAWGWWYTRLYPGATPPDHRAHVAAVVANLREPGRLAALRAMARSGCEEIDPRLDRVAAATAVVMGTADPDFPDPAEEARVVADRMSGRVVLVEGAGHYPHAEQPDTTATAITGFLAGVTGSA